MFYYCSVPASSSSSSLRSDGTLQLNNKVASLLVSRSSSSSSSNCRRRLNCLEGEEEEEEEDVQGIFISDERRTAQTSRRRVQLLFVGLGCVDSRVKSSLSSPPLPLLTTSLLLTCFFFRVRTAQQQQQHSSRVESSTSQQDNASDDDGGTYRTVPYLMVGRLVRKFTCITVLPSTSPLHHYSLPALLLLLLFVYAQCSGSGGCIQGWDLLRLGSPTTTDLHLIVSSLKTYVAYVMRPLHPSSPPHPPPPPPPPPSSLSLSTCAHETPSDVGLDVQPLTSFFFLFKKKRKENGRYDVRYDLILYTLIRGKREGEEEETRRLHVVVVVVVVAKPSASLFFKSKQTDEHTQREERERKRGSTVASAVASAWRVAGSSERTTKSNNRPIFVSRIIICLYTVTPSRIPYTADSDGRRERRKVRKKKGAFIHRIYLLNPCCCCCCGCEQRIRAELSCSAASEREREIGRARETPLLQPHRHSSDYTVRAFFFFFLKPKI